MLKFLLICWLAILIVYCLAGAIELPFFGLYRDQQSGSDACGYINKRQWVRLMDVFILGPVGMYVGYKIYRGEDLPTMLGVLIIIYGILTIAYNGANYKRNVHPERGA